MQAAELHLRVADAEPAPQGAWRHRYAVLTACCTLVLIVAGALVTSNDAGLSIPDWPLSYGKLIPPLIGGIRYEWTHRLIAGTVSMLTLGLALWLQFSESRAWVRKLGWTAVGLVAAQATLGGMTVLFFQPPWISSAHACLAQAFFCTMVSLAIYTSPSWGAHSGVRFSGARPIEKLAMFTCAAVFLQLLVGAEYRHKGLSMIWHLMGAAIVAVLIMMTFLSVLREHQQEPGARKLAHSLAGFMMLQLFLGGGSLWAKLFYADAPQPMPIFVTITTIHVAIGALTLATSVALALFLFRAEANA